MQHIAYLSLASGALAGAIPAAQQQGNGLATIHQVISNIAHEMMSLDVAIKGVGSNPQALTSTTDALVKMMTDGAAQVNKTGSITLTESISLQAPVMALYTTSQTLEKDLLSEKAAIAKAKACPAVKQDLVELSGGTANLGAAVVSKVPEQAQQIARNLVGKIDAIIKKAQADFADCKNDDSQPAPAVARRDMFGDMLSGVMNMFSGSSAAPATGSTATSGGLSSLLGKLNLGNLGGSLAAGSCPYAAGGSGSSCPYASGGTCPYSQQRTS